MPPILQVENAGWKTGNRAILQNVSFTLNAGETMCVFGPNGAGKSTLAKVILRMLPRATGNILLEGKPLASYDRPALARTVGYVPQSTGILPAFTVREFTLLGRYPHGTAFSPPTREDERIARDALSAVGAAEWADQRIDLLSGGERQVVFVAAALAQEARLLVLDEPTAYLDVRRQADLTALLHRLNRERGLSWLWVTHDVNAARGCGKVLALREGRVAYWGGAEDFLTAGTLGDVFGVRFAFAEIPGHGRHAVPLDAMREAAP